MYSYINIPEKMFLDLNNKNKSSIAAIDNSGGIITYGELIDFTEEFFSVIKKRSLIFIFTENCIGSLAGYVASLSSKVVPLLLNSSLDRSAVAKMISSFLPEYFWIPKSLLSEFNFQQIYERFGYVLLTTGLRNSDAIASATFRPALVSRKPRSSASK